MVPQLNQRFVLLTAVAALVLPTCISAQIPPRFKRCLPYPTLADEIQQMNEQSNGKSSPTDDDESDANIVVDSVTIHGGRSLPRTIRQQLTALPRQLHWYSFDEERLTEFGEVGVRDKLQSAGYFKAVVRLEGQVLSSDANSQHVAITIHIEEGPRCYLRSLKLRAADPDLKSLPFAYKTLRQKIPLREGEIFDISKLRSGLQSLTRLFHAHGISISPLSRRPKSMTSLIS